MNILGKITDIVSGYFNLIIKKIKIWCIIISNFNDFTPKTKMKDNVSFNDNAIIMSRNKIKINPKYKPKKLHYKPLAVTHYIETPQTKILEKTHNDDFDFFVYFE